MNQQTPMLDIKRLVNDLKMEDQEGISLLMKFLSVEEKLEQSNDIYAS
jgi:hypothetical protein